MRQHYVSYVAIVCIVLSGVFFCLRAWARLVHSRRWIWADLLITVSLLLNSAAAAVILVSYHDSGNYHRHPPSTTVLKLVGICSPILYGFASVFPRLAILDVYLSIFTSRRIRYMLLTTGVAITINAIVYIPTTITQCRPISRLWDMTIEGKCNDTTLHYGLAGLPNIISDVILLILPIRIVWNLNLERATKVGVQATFVAGNVGLVASLFRTVTVFGWNPQKRTYSRIITASMIETSTTFIAACLLSMRPLVQRFIGDMANMSTPRSLSWYKSYTLKRQQKRDTKTSGQSESAYTVDGDIHAEDWADVEEEEDRRESVIGSGNEEAFELKSVEIGREEAMPKTPPQGPPFSETFESTK